jgi:class 3 adenylate cyclase
LQQHEQQGESHTAHASHFIPSDFLHLIQAEHIAPQQASVAYQQSLTCLVIHMSPPLASRMPEATRDVFQALQTAALQIGTVIRQHHGFIDACYAQALVAYFPGRPNDALQAARTLHQSSTEPLRIGIHMADTLLGIVDDGQRWHPVVLPDVRATAEYLAHLTQTYQTTILMSESVLGYLEDAEHAQGTRRDQVQIPGSPEPVTLFSIP